MPNCYEIRVLFAQANVGHGWLLLMLTLGRTVSFCNLRSTIRTFQEQQLGQLLIDKMETSPQIICPQIQCGIP
jgi:hypothetical protein